MAVITLDKGHVIYEGGMPLTALHLITSGKVQLHFPSGSITLNPGDVIGVCELCSEVHFLSYSVSEEAGIVTYPVPNIEALDNICKTHLDLSRLFVLSAIRQICAILEKSSQNALNCSNFYLNLDKYYRKYLENCEINKLTPQKLTGYDSLSGYISDESPDYWLLDYYLGLSHIYSGNDYGVLVKDPAITSGMLRKASLDFRKSFFSLEEMNTYLKRVGEFYFNNSTPNLFTMYSELFFKLDSNNPVKNELFAQIEQMVTIYKKCLGINKLPEEFENKLLAFKNKTTPVLTSKTSTDNDKVNSLPDTLVNSLDKILNFSEADEAFKKDFTMAIALYKKIPDKYSTDETVCKLRGKITEGFYTLYQLIFFKCQKIEAIPTVIKMFLYFGYLDETLAGNENVRCLERLSNELNFDGTNHVYTFYSFLTAIYEGKLMPSRNEFDQDYSDYIHKQKINGSITEAYAKDLLNDSSKKVIYELTNSFQTINKISFGRISSYCPVFIKENVFKDLESSLVTISKLTEGIKKIKSVDFSAFYREFTSSESYDYMGNEPVHCENYPNFILMPNVGIKGVMWQEIEGKKRNSPGRMFISVFHLEDLNMTLLQLTGQFRWELCKRIQGSRWNDITDRSLCSEYFDYVQFYKKNRELTPEAKEKVRLNLQRAKNSFKEMFVRDYITWIMFESAGSPRLNKVARKIFFTYCPFSADIMLNVSKNPIYTEGYEHYKLTQAQKLHRLELIVQKLRNNSKPVPDILENEIEYIKGETK